MFILQTIGELNLANETGGWLNQREVILISSLSIVITIVLGLLCVWVYKRKKKRLSVIPAWMSPLSAAIVDHILPCGSLLFHLMWLGLISCWYVCVNGIHGFRARRRGRQTRRRRDEEDVGEVDLGQEGEENHDAGRALAKAREEVDLARAHRERAKRCINRTREMQHALAERMRYLAGQTLDMEIRQRMMEEWTTRLRDREEFLNGIAANLDSSISALSRLPSPPTTPPGSDAGSPPPVRHDGTKGATVTPSSHHPPSLDAPVSQVTTSNDSFRPLIGPSLRSIK